MTIFKEEPMPEAPYAPDEKKRMAAVQQTHIMGTPAEERFDKITRLARRLFNVPMAAIDIVGAQVAWIKSGQGIDQVIALRKDSYCHHTVLNNELCFVSDARNDPRFFDSAFSNQWVFYAGVPIHFKGQRVGVFCIGDTQPREFSQEDRDGLLDLAGLVEQEFQICALSETQIELAQENEELEKKNRIDPLTHGWNRSAILDILMTELSMDNSLSVITIDVDFFKNINDTYGHPAGDEILRVVAERIRTSVRPIDAIGRYGGDEFLAVLVNLNHEETIKIGQRICEEIIKTPIYFDDWPISVTCSVGCAIKKAEDDIDSLIKRSDKALYQAKQEGRNRAATTQ